MEGRRPHRPLVVAVLFLLVAGCLSAEKEEEKTAGFPPPPDGDLVAHFMHLAEGREVRFDTQHGTIRMLLYDALMPTTTAHFAELTEGGFYDGTIIHRVVDDFVIQGGDRSGTGFAGSGETIPHEVHPDLLFGAGAVGLARDVDPDSGDSQWFITERPAPHLSDPSRSRAGEVFGAFALYAQVFEGMDVVRRIAAEPVIPGADRPIEDVHLRDAELTGPPAVDLLQFPPTLRLEEAATLQRPLHPLAAHPFTVTVFVAAAEDEGPPDEVMVEYVLRNATTGEEMARDLFPLDALPDDPTVFTGTILLDHPGRWEEVLHVDGSGSSTRLTVHPWHDAYARFVTAGT